MVASRYESYVQLPREHKIHIFELTCNVFYYIITIMQVYIVQLSIFFVLTFSFSSEKDFTSYSENFTIYCSPFLTVSTNREKAGNDVIDIFTSENMENTLLRFRPCSFLCILRVVYFPVKQPCLYNKTVEFGRRRNGRDESKKIGFNRYSLS